MSGAEIAAEVAEALAEVGAEVGTGEYFATLRQFENGGPAHAPVFNKTDTTITVVDLNERVRDKSGTLIGETRRTLLVSTSAGVTITKADKVAVGQTDAEVATAEASLEPVAWHEIATVEPLSPGGTVIMWTLTLVT